jgi:hypothetical protein
MNVYYQNPAGAYRGLVQEYHQFNEDIWNAFSIVLTPFSIRISRPGWNSSYSPFLSAAFPIALDEIRYLRIHSSGAAVTGHIDDLSYRITY